MANTDPRTADEILRELYNNDDATSIDEIFRQVYGSGSNNTIMCGPNCKYTTVQAAVDAAAARYQELYIMQGVDCMPGNYTSEDLVIPEGVVLYARYPGTVSAGAITLNGGTVYDIYDDVSGIQYSQRQKLA